MTIRELTSSKVTSVFITLLKHTLKGTILITEVTSCHFFFLNEYSTILKRRECRDITEYSLEVILYQHSRVVYWTFFLLKAML